MSFNKVNNVRQIRGSTSRWQPDNVLELCPATEYLYMVAAAQISHPLPNYAFMKHLVPWLIHFVHLGVAAVCLTSGLLNGVEHFSGKFPIGTER